MYAMLRRFLFLFPPEPVHYFSMNLLKIACALPPIRKLVASLFLVRDKSLSKEAFGLHFSNPVGLGAGFDKNARYLRELEVLGFGFVEIGTVTPRPQEGNPKPRLFRLPKDRALINRMGFNNEGVNEAARRLKEWRKSFPSSKLIVGGNIGKNKTTPNEEAWKDYEICFRTLHPFVDFFVVNVSSPNTPGLRELQEKDSLRKILTRLQEINKGFETQRPILLKIAPDLTSGQLREVMELASEISLDGIVSSNTTISRDNLHTSKDELEKIGAGGLSGKPVLERSNEVLAEMHEKDRSLPLIASGGIENAADAKQKLERGAVLVEVWTGFVYGGPSIVKRICRGLN